LITAADLQRGVEESGNTQLQLTSFAASLLAVLLNAWIYETVPRDTHAEPRASLAGRHRVATDFVYRELPTVLRQLVRESRRFGGDAPDGPITSIDIIHWINPRWPEASKETPALAFIFDKE